MIKANKRANKKVNKGGANACKGAQAIANAGKGA